MDKPQDIETPCESRRRGRPPRGTEALRQAQILKAAETIFLEQGFGATSMEAVAKLAGVSKKTIYAFFDTKETLFEAVMRAHTAGSDRPVPDPNVTDMAGVERALTDYLNRLAHFILGPFAVSLFRISVAEAERFPAIAKAFYREGALRSVHQLEDWLRAQSAKGILALENPYDGAIMLTSVIVLEPLRAAALGVAPLPTDAMIDARTKMAAHIFLRGCAAR